MTPTDKPSQGTPREQPSASELLRLSKSDLAHQLWGEIRTNIELNSQLRALRAAQQPTASEPPRECAMLQCNEPRILNSPFCTGHAPAPSEQEMGGARGVGALVAEWREYWREKLGRGGDDEGTKVKMDADLCQRFNSYIFSIGRRAALQSGDNRAGLPEHRCFSDGYTINRLPCCQICGARIDNSPTSDGERAMAGAHMTFEEWDERDSELREGQHLIPVEYAKRAWNAAIAAAIPASAPAPLDTPSGGQRFELSPQVINAAGRCNDEMEGNCDCPVHSEFDRALAMNDETTQGLQKGAGESRGLRETLAQLRNTPLSKYISAIDYVFSTHDDASLAMGMGRDLANGIFNALESALSQTEDK
jgi:hypothetical protein